MSDESEPSPDDESEPSPDDESGTLPADEILIVDDGNLPRSARGKYTHLPEPVDPAEAFETVDVSGPPPEPGNEGTEREWVARYG